jgi:hypothetical protein
MIFGRYIEAPGSAAAAAVPASAAPVPAKMTNAK